MEALFGDLILWFEEFFACSWHGYKVYLKSVMLTAYEMLTDFFMAIYEMTWNVAIHAITYLLSGETGFVIADYFDDLPPEVLAMISLIGLDVAMLMIAGAIAIRMSLQLIPFTRLGS